MHITIYATCQGLGLKHYLGYYYNFNKITVLHNYMIVKNSEPLNLKLLKNTDIFIYQEMPRKWGKYSTDESLDNNILTNLKNTCIKISIPYVYCDWLWSVVKVLVRDSTTNFDNINSNTELECKYINIDYIETLKKTYKLEEIIKLYDNNKLDFDYEKRKLNSINILKKKEETCMVKISDFILKNYKKNELFFTHNHPSYIINYVFPDRCK